MSSRGWEHVKESDIAAKVSRGSVRATRMPQKARSKYNATPTSVDGILFDSKREASRYTELKLLEKAGEIHDLRLQQPLELATYTTDPSDVRMVGKWLADFVYCTCLRTPCARHHLVYEDVKGFKTPLYKWKKKHVEAQYGIQIREVR